MLLQQEKLFGVLAQSLPISRWIGFFASSGMIHILRVLQA
jgi:hypothetical protein